jgi:hypothetical protein
MGDNMKEIPLTCGFVAKVDDEDHEELSRYKWHTHVCSASYVYAARWTTVRLGEKDRGEKRRLIRMHQQILEFPECLVDHKDHDGLNNQRYNLRPCTYAENNCNRKTSIRNLCGVKGVSQSGKRWVVNIQCGGKRYVFYCKSLATASKMYDAKAKELFGEFAWTNS